MRTKNITDLFLAMGLVLGGVFVLSSITDVATVFANHEFSANLTGQEEVPPVDTQATAEAIFVPIAPANETIDYFLNSTNLSGVTQGHIHSGEKGVNGPIVVTLFSYNTTQDAVSENGTITADNLEGPLQGKTVADLISAMKNSSTYVNFHTEQNPEGEIRGQLNTTS
ncbi:CHRD domain-containing protein [Candidatus Nitrosocosmicus franklandus]|uniref:CHRD domain protein n=1 Tax=Candidatus Nitrosocosmicus franklandianus TaxID=1798806 RepID=A0A484IB20_9ARCH|nr:CHRD domain-containing protein [Candidatus Nitrosocosmicus franklandus]VFJ14962.1 CHRD domain protein [Candidatus Nitrosocosmicus franklandus]